MRSALAKTGLDQFVATYATLDEALGSGRSAHLSPRCGFPRAPRTPLRPHVQSTTRTPAPAALVSLAGLLWRRPAERQWQFFECHQPSGGIVSTFAGLLTSLSPLQKAEPSK